MSTSSVCANHGLFGRKLCLGRVLDYDGVVGSGKLTGCGSEFLFCRRLFRLTGSRDSVEPGRCCGDGPLNTEPARECGCGRWEVSENPGCRGAPRNTAQDPANRERHDC
jgi:hypothetical protein